MVLYGLIFWKYDDLHFWTKFGISVHSASPGGLPMRDKKRAQHTRFCRFTTSPLKRQTEHQGSYGHTLVVGFNSDNQLAWVEYPLAGFFLSFFSSGLS